MKFKKMVPEMVTLPGERALWFCEFTFEHIVTTYNPEVEVYGGTVRLCTAHLANGFGELKYCHWPLEPLIRVSEPIHPMDLHAAQCRHQPITYQSKHADWHIAAIRKLEARKFE